VIDEILSTSGNRCDSRIAKRYLWGVLLLAAVLYTGAVVMAVVQHSYFIDDDYDNFYLILHDSFWGYFFTPIDDQFVPLHRLFTYLIYVLFPLNFPVAVGVLLVLHVLGAWYVHKILQLLGESSANRVLMFLYATNVYLFVPLMWWSSGIHRFSYVLLSAMCIYYYLEYRITTRRRYLFGSFAVFLVAFFIYSKSPLIPAYLLGLDLCLMQKMPGPKSARRLLVLVPFFAASVMHVILYRLNMPEAFGRFTLDLQFLAAFVGRSFYYLGHGLFTAVYHPENAVLNITIALSYLSLFTYSVVKKRANILIWVLGMGVIGLNSLLIAASPRNIFGLSNLLTHRYYFELVFLAVIFLKLILSNIPSRDALSGLPERAQRVLLSTHFQIVLILVYACLSFYNCRVLMSTPRYSRHDQVKVYMENLSAGIAGFKADPPANLSFTEGAVPEYVTGFRWKMRPYSIFLQIFALEASYGVPTEDFYTITEAGEVRKVE